MNLMTNITLCLLNAYTYTCDIYTNTLLINSFLRNRHDTLYHAMFDNMFYILMKLLLILELIKYWCIQSN